MRKVDISEAVEILRRGELVCLPTETVYGLGADGLNADADLFTNVILGYATATCVGER
jgi:tRNA A37 threonylcarbamoyladenosine synthetase subunit TsaC/SUA5/YrdC